MAETHIPAATNNGSATQARVQCNGLVAVFDGLDRHVSRSNGRRTVRLAILLNAVGRRSYGPLLLIVGLFAISPATILPGMTSLTALVIFLIAMQMALGFSRPWLPKRVLALQAPRRPLFAFIDRARPAIDRVDGVWLRRRWTVLTAPPFANLVALCVALAALATLPLSIIPFAPLAPGIAIVLFGLGLAARDGVWLALGAAFTAATLWLAAPMLTLWL